MEINQILSAVAKAYRVFRDRFESGKTSSQLFEAFTDSLKESLGTYEIAYDFLCGADTVNIDGVTKDYLPQPGDTVLMDISVGKDGVWCDVCRTFFVGEPSQKQRELFELIRTSLQEGQKALKPGATACDVFRAVDGVYQTQGLRLIHHAGHRIGEAPLLQPQFLEENQAPLQAGQTYTVESGCYHDFGIRLENDYLLTKSGAVDLFESLLPLQIKEYVLK